MRFFIIIAMLLIPLPSLAESVPVPDSKKERLGNLDKRLNTYKSEEKKLTKEAKAISSDIESTKNQLIGVAKSIQQNETDLQALENNIVVLEDDKNKLQGELKKDRASIAKLIIALERIRRVPPEAMIARPDAPIKTARSAMLMQDILPALNAQSQELKYKLGNLKQIEEDLNLKRSEALSRSAQLKVAQKDLKALAGKRETLYASVNADIKDRQKQVKRISREARNLNDLVKRLEKERAKARKLAEQQKADKRKAAIRKASFAPLPSTGKSRLPLNGVIRTGYNELDSFGAKSKGISIEGRSGALIVAPMGGIIRFAGYFKNYGNMVILEHKNGYHSLIAGLEKIDTVVDQSISAGEPLGTLYDTSNGKAPTLYYELRHKGKAINPANKLNLG